MSEVEQGPTSFPFIKEFFTEERNMTNELSDCRFNGRI